MAYETTQPAEQTNCFACGKSLEMTRFSPKHNPEPTSDSDQCVSRSRKYSNLRCMYAVGHECAHTAKVAGTGRTYWQDDDAV
jgi:hypothetical protein